jgi:hypothetical protein
VKKVHRQSLWAKRVIATGALLVALGGSAAVGQANSEIASAFKLLTLQNGWTGGPFSTSLPAVAKINGIVYFKGAMSTSGSNPVAFTLPPALRPAKAVYVTVDLANAVPGRLIITPNGVVSVEPMTGFGFQYAATFTSLDGAHFAP